MCRFFEIFFSSFASFCRVFETFFSLFSKLDRIFEIVYFCSSKLLTSFRFEIFHAFFFRTFDVFSTLNLSCFFFRTSEDFSTRDFSRLFFRTFDVFSTQDLSRFFLKNCDVWSRWKNEKRNIKKMRTCLMIILDKISIEWIFERQQKAVFCLLKEIIDSFDSIFLFEQTVISFAVRFKSFWVKTRKEEEDKFIIDKNVFKDSIWVRINIHRKCIRWYASSLECFHARAQSNLHWTSLTINQNEFFEMNYRDELSKNFSEWIIEGFFRVNYREKFFVEFTLTEILNLKSLATLTRFY